MKNLKLSLMGAILAGIALPAGLTAQTQFVGRDYFPAQLEFKELEAIRSDRTIDKPSGLAAVPSGNLIAEAGFSKDDQRVYAVPGGTLSVEVLTLNDPKAAYSLLTLFRRDVIKAGPPGDWVSSLGNSLLFVRGNFLVRVEGDGPPELTRRVATSVSNRIGEREPVSLALVRRLASREGYDPGSLRYFVGPKAFAELGKPVGGKPFEFKPDMEITQAAYSSGGRHGVLTVVSFPTSQIAEEYFDSVAGTLTASSDGHLYTRRSGPMVGFLDGSFDSKTADAILGTVQYSYSVKWIYDKKRSANIVWGIPMGVLGTVVRSLVFVALLCGASLLVGAGVALARFFLRSRASYNLTGRPEESDIIRLKIDEN